MTNNGNDSAYPLEESTWQSDAGEFGGGTDGGLTKREQFAAMAMQGLLSYGHSPAIAKNAVTYADQLIAALNEQICNECKCSLSDGHYDAEHDICSIAERASQ